MKQDEQPENTNILSIEVDDVPQMSLLLFKHIAWPKVIPNCYSESSFA